MIERTCQVAGGLYEAKTGSSNGHSRARSLDDRNGTPLAGAAAGAVRLYGALFPLQLVARQLSTVPPPDCAALRSNRAGDRIHLLGHSLGGLVIARMLEQGDLANQGRIVLLGSPQQGSALASSLECCRAGRFILGPLAVEGIVRNRPAALAGRELLVVAGTLSFGFARFFGVAVPNDGTVAAVETQVPGASRLLVRASHMGMLFSKTAAAAICKFLSHKWHDVLEL